MKIRANHVLYPPSCCTNNQSQQQPKEPFVLDTSFENELRYNVVGDKADMQMNMAGASVVYGREVVNSPTDFPLSFEFRSEEDRDKFVTLLQPLLLLGQQKQVEESTTTNNSEPTKAEEEDNKDEEEGSKEMANETEDDNGGGVPPPKKAKIADGNSDDGNEEESHLSDLSQKIISLLKVRQPRNIEGVATHLHPLPPFVTKSDWAELGDAIKVAERPPGTCIPGEKWITLRCDGTGFSKLTKYLTKNGIIDGPGYSHEFASIMQSCCQEMMVKFHARCGYTHSDELTVLIPPASIVRGEQQEHPYNGRLQKICSLAAATVTAKFNRDLMALCFAKISNKNKKSTTDDDDNDNENPLTVLDKCATPTFDCRVGMYDTEEEALSLLFWRAYDCGVNATSDAVFKSGIPGSKKVVGLATDQRLLWLVKHGLLPLPDHQRDGSFYIKRKRLEHGVNRKTGEKVSYIRGRIEKLEGNILKLFQDDALFPPDDTMIEDNNNKKKKKKGAN